METPWMCHMAMTEEEEKQLLNLSHTHRMKLQLNTHTNSGMYTRDRSLWMHVEIICYSSLVFYLFYFLWFKAVSSFIGMIASHITIHTSPECFKCTRWKTSVLFSCAVVLVSVLLCLKYLHKMYLNSTLDKLGRFAECKINLKFYISIQ